MSGNPWVRGAGGERPEPEPTDEPEDAARPPRGGFSGVQLPPRPQSFDNGGRRSGRGGSGGFLSKLPGGGPPVWLVAVIAAVIVLAVVGAIALKLIGGSSSSTTAPTPTPSQSPSVSSQSASPTRPSTPASTPPSTPATQSSMPVPPTQPSRPATPANATTVSAVDAWFVPAARWGATAQTASDERSEPGSRELAYPSSGSPQAHYWVRGKDQGAQAWALEVERAYAQQYPGLRITRQGAFTCPSGFTACYQVAFAYTANQVSTIGAMTTYQRAGFPTVGIDFGSSVSASARTNADALAMTTSLIKSF